MALTSFSTDKVDFVLKDDKTLVRIWPWRELPPDEHERRRWNLYFVNYSRIDLTQYLEELQADGYRISKDIADKVNSGDTDVSFICTKDLIITSAHASKSIELEDKTVFADMYKSHCIGDIMLLAKQREKPLSMKGQLAVIEYEAKHGKNTSKHRVIIKVTEDTVEEFMSKFDKTKLIRWWQPSLEEIVKFCIRKFYLKTISSRMKRRATYCRFVKHQCNGCKFLQCFKRNSCFEISEPEKPEEPEFKSIIDIFLDEKK